MNPKQEDFYLQRSSLQFRLSMEEKDCGCPEQGDIDLEGASIEHIPETREHKAQRPEHQGAGENQVYNRMGREKERRDQADILVIATNVA